MKKTKRYKASIRHLSGKYYGTYVDVVINKEEKISIRIWLMGDYEPSIRELSEVGITISEWRKNKLRKPCSDGLGGTTRNPHDLLELCDSHYETKDGLNLAKLVCKAINGACNEEINKAKPHQKTR